MHALAQILKKFIFFIFFGLISSASDRIPDPQNLYPAARLKVCQSALEASGSFITIDQAVPLLGPVLLSQTLIYESSTKALIIDLDHDPVLVKTLKETKEKFQDGVSVAKDNAALSVVLKDLAEFVRTKLAIDPTRTFQRVMHPVRAKSYSRLEAFEATYLGEFIRSGAGNGRHRAVLLQLVLQQLGFDSKLIYGHLLRPGNLSLEVHLERHTWVEVQLPGRQTMILDPTQKIYHLTSSPRDVFSLRFLSLFLYSSSDEQIFVSRIKNWGFESNGSGKN